MDAHVTFILDSSGSMESIKDDTIAGFNSFLKEQRTEEGSATVSLYEFDSTVTRQYLGQPIEEAPILSEETFVPGGRTALYDALYTGLTETPRLLMEEQSTHAVDAVIIVVLTDGMENASETSHQQVRDLVTISQEKYGWDILFIGANQDAALSASKMGIDGSHALSMDHSSEGTRAAYKSTSRRISNARQEGSTGGFEEEDRRQQRADSLNRDD